MQECEGEGVGLGLRCNPQAKQSLACSLQAEPGVDSGLSPGKRGLAEVGTSLHFSGLPTTHPSDARFQDRNRAAKGEGVRPIGKLGDSKLAKNDSE